MTREANSPIDRTRDLATCARPTQRSLGRLALLALGAFLAVGNAACATLPSASNGAAAVSSEKDGLACVESALRHDPPKYALEGAEEHFRSGCEQRQQPGACSVLGVMYELGRGVRQDVPRAAALYENACQRGHSRACLNLGQLHADGRGVRKHAFQAAVLFDFACRGSNQDGCHRLALAYLAGDGVDASVPRAAELLEGSCAHGHTASCVDLGEIHERGRGITHDLTRAVQLYERACGGGDVAGCFKLENALRPGSVTSVAAVRPAGGSQAGAVAAADR